VSRTSSRMEASKRGVCFGAAVSAAITVQAK
jgi:hypothetical protein